MATAIEPDLRPMPDERGHFGPYGGIFVAETLMAPLAELESAWLQARDDPGFRDELGMLLRDFAGRPTPLYHARRRPAPRGRRARATPPRRRR